MSPFGSGKAASYSTFYKILINFVCSKANVMVSYRPSGVLRAVDNWFHLADFPHVIYLLFSINNRISWSFYYLKKKAWSFLVILFFGAIN